MTTGCVVYVCVNLWKSVIVHYCQSYGYFMYLNETLGSRGAPIIGYRKYPISANIFHMGNPISISRSDIIFGWSSGGQEAIPYTNTHVSTYPVSAYLYRSVNMQTDDESFNTTIVTLIILDQLCFMGFTNLFISAIGILIKSHFGKGCTSTQKYNDLVYAYILLYTY